MPRRRNDLDIYERHADEWWQDDSPAFRSLRSAHEQRLAQLRAWLGPRLHGKTIADLGCGGGLLAVPLAQEGARVVGVDLSPRSLAAAAAEAHRRGTSLACVRGDVCAPPLADASADVVLLADVLEHVSDPNAAIAAAARVVRDGGLVFVTTINRTWRARLLAITVAEGLRLVPPGTHDARLFVRPAELTAAAARVGLHVVRLQGEAPALLATLRAWTVVLRPSRSTAVGYVALLQRGRVPFSHGDGGGSGNGGTNGDGHDGRAR